MEASFLFLPPAMKQRQDERLGVLPNKQTKRWKTSKKAIGMVGLIAEDDPRKHYARAAVTDRSREETRMCVEKTGSLDAPSPAWTRALLAATIWGVSGAYKLTSPWIEEMQMGQCG